VTEIEFLDPGPAADPAGDGPDDGAGGPDLRRLVPALAAAVAWVLAAGLAVMASVSTVYSVVVTSGGVHESIDLDAWGRYHVGGFVPTSGHQPRYSILLIAAAVVLLAAALTSVVRLDIGRYLAVAGTAGAATAAGALALSVQAYRSTAQRGDLATDATMHTDIGSAVWLAAGTAVAAALGLVLAFVLKAPEPAFQPTAAEAAPEPVTEAPAVALGPGGGGPANG
jgi:hypothetical protein